MKHLRAGKKLGRDTNKRKALLNNLADSLVEHGQLNTTLAKAKFVSAYVEKTITIAKKNKLGSNRILASNLSKNSFKKLITEIAPGYSDRHGGYTRIIKLKPRLGDNANMARLELTEWSKNTSSDSSKTSKKIQNEKKPRKKVIIKNNKSTKITTQKMKKEKK